MSDIAIKFENVSKQYRLGGVGTGTISHDLNRWWAGVRGKEDPYLKIGEANDRSTKGSSEYVWALRDIDFEVKQGEVLGIIGRNGAGKSTLLKILSKVTAPTTGMIKAKGRIASLLEVGTGFHPEMTGRENIFMNGAIMGMSKAEIRRKLDEIVDFAGVERYLDTPVKRYSSGMTVRLGFAIAAHLEPEILVVDEVLAVGDAEFQKKAIGKMQDVSQNKGRTVLFVSHNMGAVRSLCSIGMILKNGIVSFCGNADDAVNLYLAQRKGNERLPHIAETSKYRRNIVSMVGEITSIGFSQQRKENVYASDEVIKFFTKVKGLTDGLSIRTGGSIYNMEDQRIGLFFSKDYIEISKGEEYLIEVNLPNHNLSIGEYYLSVSIGTGDPTTGNTEYDILHEVLYFEIQSEMYNDKSSQIIKWEKSWGNILFPSQSKLINNEPATL